MGERFGWVKLHAALEAASASARPSFDDAWHLVHGGTTLRPLASKRVLIFEDALENGPVSNSPLRHRVLREEYWRTFYRRLPSIGRGGTWKSASSDLISANDLKKRLKNKRPIVLWSGGTWLEILFVWWACDALIRCEIDPAEVWVGSATGELAKWASRLSPTHIRRREFLSVLAFNRRCDAEFLSTGARLWGAFCHGDLGVVEAHRAAAVPHLPIHSSDFIPEVRGHSRLFLSSYDTRLLGLFASGEWNSAIASLSSPDTRRTFISLLDGHGDLLISIRLSEWAHHAPDILECRRAENPKSYSRVFEYRLTARGVAMLVEGFDSPTIAPPMTVGGYIAYGLRMKWAKRVVNDNWHFVALNNQEHP